MDSVDCSSVGLRSDYRQSACSILDATCGFWRYLGDACPAMNCDRERR